MQWIFNYVYFNNKLKNLKNRIYTNFFNLYMEDSNSFLYKKKNFILQKLIKNNN
jgi:hypothetical protein